MTGGRTPSLQSNPAQYQPLLLARDTGEKEGRNLVSLH
jgi:hypothetical protein